MRVRADAWVSLAAGVSLGALALAALLLIALDDAATARGILLQTAVHLAAGREASIPTGLAAGLAWPASWLSALALEWTMLLTLFPLVVLFHARLRSVARIRALLARAEAYAERRPHTGVLALGVLTLFPGLPVGALTSALIGETLGLPARRLLPMLMAAEAIANLYVALGVATFAAQFPDARLVAGTIAGVALGVSLAVTFWPALRPAPEGE